MSVQAIGDTDSLYRVRDLSDFSSRLGVVIAAAAPLPDRASAGSPASEFVTSAASDRSEFAKSVRTWLSRATGDPRAVGALIGHLADTSRPLGQGLRRVELRDPAVVPDWAAALATFLHAQPAQPNDETDEVGTPFASFQRAAEVLLAYENGSILGVSVAPDAWSDIAGTLVRRLAEACNLAFCYELQTDGGGAESLDWLHHPGPDCSDLGWLERIERLPGLGFVVGTVCRQWRDAFTELFTRLAVDLPLLSIELWEVSHPGPLTALRGDAGDRHADGRSVALLTFANGHGVAYKPKDMRHATVFMALIDFLNTRGATLDLATRTIIERTDEAADGPHPYGWEQLIEATPCATSDGFTRFYRRLGMMIRLVQLLEGRDLWADNLLAAGEQPHLIDLECLLYPRVQPPPAVPSGQHGLLDVLESTVVRTAMPVQPWVPSKERPVVDIGCLSRAGDMLDQDGKPVLPLPPYRPTLPDGTIADAWAFSEQVVAGYREMHQVLAVAQQELAHPDGPLAAFSGIWVRYIWRHTWDGYKIIRASLSPRSLVDGATRETVLAGALRGAMTAVNERADRQDLIEVVLAEIESFRVLDIPMFRSLTTSSSVFTVDGHEIPGHFQSTAWQRLFDRVAELETFDLDGQVAVLTGCIDAARAGSSSPLPSSSASLLPSSGRSSLLPSGGARPAVPSSERLLREAIRIGDTVLAARHATDTGGGWLALSWYPLTGLRQVETAGIDFVSGGAGIATLLCELWAATGEPRFFQAAHQTLVAAADLVGTSTAFASDTRLAGGVAVAGGLAGPGALIHALAHGAERLGDPGLLARAQALVPAAAGLAAVARHYSDLPGGTAGLLANLLRLRRASGPGHTPTDEAISRLAAGALADLTVGPTTRYAQPEQVADLVPTGSDSVAMVLARALREAPELLDVEAVQNVLSSYRFDLNTRGGRLAAGSSKFEQPEAAALSCRDLVASAGVALGADRTEDAAPLITELLDRRERTGRWYSDRGIDDSINLGALDGIPAVGLLLLRFIDPDTAVPAVLR
jgi:type 2 lantibiotic biosynthesis protein LanM